jgi:hypothetical protein
MEYDLIVVVAANLSLLSCTLPLTCWSCDRRTHYLAVRKLESVPDRKILCKAF